MKPTLLERVYMVTLVAVLVGVVFHAPLTVFLSVQFPDASLVIKSWKEIVLLLLVPFATVIAVRRKLWHEIMQDWLFRLIGLYAVLHLVLLPLLWQGVLPTFAGLAIDLRYILFFCLVYVAVRAMPKARRQFLVAGSIGAVVIVGFAILQLFLPPDILIHIGYSKDTIMPYLTVDKNPDYVRVNSTLRGPNPLGAYAGMVLALVAAFVVRGKLALQNKKLVAVVSILAICAAIALWISYSRSALVAGIVAVGVVVAATAFRRLSRTVWIVSAAVLFALVGGVLAARDTPFVSNVIFHENPDGGSEVSSNDDHVSSLQYGIGQLLREPFGSGVGSTGSASLLGDRPVIVENQYLFIGHEVGVVGLLLFLGIFGVLMRRLWHRRQDWVALGLFAGGVGLSLIGLLLPVWVDDTISIVWWGLVAVVIGGGYARQQTK